MPRSLPTSHTDLNDATDDLLVQRAGSGDMGAFNILSGRYIRLIYGIGWAITGRREDADDVVQDTFVSAYSRLYSLKNGRKFAPWISQIARNTALDVLDKRKRHRIDENWLRERDLVSTPAEQLDEFNRLNHLWFAINKLPTDDKITVVLHYFVGLDQQSVSNTLGVPLGTVKSRLNRARRKLKGEMIQMKTKNFNASGPEDDFGRSGLGGMEGDITWEPLLRGDGLEGWCETDVPLANSTPAERGISWTRNGNAVMGKVPAEKTSQIVQGDANWRDYEISALCTLIEGPDVQIHFRVSEEGQAYYMLNFLYGWQAIAISKMEPGAGEVDKLSVVNFPFEKGREYNILIAARAQSLTSYIDGKLVNQVTDNSYRKGGIALGLWWSSVNFRDPRIRHIH